MTRVFLIDDHELVRTGFRMILESDRDIVIVGEAESGEAALPVLRRVPADIVLCDLNLGGISGLEVTERLIRGQYGCRVIIVSMLRDGPMPKRLLEAGASGYLAKACPADELLRAVREVAAGRRFLGSDIAQTLALRQLCGSDSPFDCLTARELEVAVQLARGGKLHEVGRQLSLSPKTVATHKYRLLQKLGISDTVSLSRLLDQYGIGDAADPAVRRTAG